MINISELTLLFRYFIRIIVGIPVLSYPAQVYYLGKTGCQFRVYGQLALKYLLIQSELYSYLNHRMRPRQSFT